MKLLAVTGTGLRHRIFLSLLNKELGAHWSNTLIQGDQDAFIGSSEIKKTSAAKAFYSSGSHLYRRMRRHILCAQFKDIPLEKILFDAEEESVESLLMKKLPEDIFPLQPDQLKSPLYDEDPNKDNVYEWLLDANPDLILVFGGKILKGPWLTTPRLGAMNMHYGYLPFYRSSSSIPFALFHERLDLAGSTIHYIDAGIDTGPIIRRGIAKIHPPTTLSSVLADVYMTGITNLVDCAKTAINTNARLRVETAKAESSYYPSKLASSIISRIAGLRVKFKKKSWPVMQNSITADLNANRKKTAVLRKLFNKKYKYPHGVYIFLYHSVIDPENANDYELAYKKVAVSLDIFKSHMKYLMENMAPLKLSEAPGVLSRGNADRAYFVITFDDGYKNILSNAQPVLNEHGIEPTVFVNGAFANGGAYYRAILSFLLSAGHTNDLVSKLKSVLPGVPWSSDRDELFRLTKNLDTLQIVQAIEKAVFSVYENKIGPLRNSGIHLSIDEVKALQSNNWEIGNHTYSHWPLDLCDSKTIDDELSRNEGFWKTAGAPLMNWISYPNGRVRDVTINVKSWMDDHPNSYGIFADEGVNIIPSRTEWLRICAMNTPTDELEKQIHMSLIATKLSLSNLTLERSPTR